mgnify:CR=1 FL=1
MSARILAYIQAAVLAMSSVQTTASTIPTDYPVLAIEAETASETETETQEKTETEKQDVTETETETQEKTETEKQDVTETETQDETETQEKTETEDTTGTEDETGTETEDVSETETEDVTGTETEEMTETETEDATETEDETETEDVQEIETASESGIDTAQYLTTVDAVGEKLRESLTNREAEITVYYQTTEEPGSEIAAEIWDKALEHTGKPTQGDYLLFQYESLEIPDYDIIVEPSASAKNGETPAEMTYYLPITYKLTYYTTYGQETELDREVEKVIERFEFHEDTSDYQKIKAIYDFCVNDIGGNLDDSDDASKHTAYGALINKTASCQGYASLLYRLLLESGIDSRIISGTANGENHVWNIVKYGDFYYYLDVAGDAEKTGYSYFLKGSDNFGDHTMGMAYASEEFMTMYPISKTDAFAEDAVSGSETYEESEAGTEVMENTGDEEATEAVENTEDEEVTETGADTAAESDMTDRDGQERDERPIITESGVLFPGKKADGYSAVYTGEKICPTMTVKYTYQDSKGKSKVQTLRLNVDYTVTYRNNIEVGGETATVTVRGIGEYRGTVTKAFNITQKSIKKVTLSAVGDIKYGETPKVTVMDGSKELVEDRDYTVRWTEGNPDTTTVSTLTVNAVESSSCNYTGTASKKVTFNILGADAENAAPTSDLHVEWKNPNKVYTYNGKAQKPAVVVKDKEGKKVSSRYYKVIYTNNVNAGTNTAKVHVVGVTKKGAGYYGISEPLAFSINQKSFGKVSVSIKGTLPKFGTISDIQNAINEAVVVKDGKTVLSYGEDYTIGYGDINSFDNIKIGTKYKITILPVRRDGNYTSDTKTLGIKFGQLNLASKTAAVSMTITNVDEKKVTFVYNGKTLEQEKDYKVVSIKKDKNTGMYTVKVKAVAGSPYKGSLTFKGAQATSLTLNKNLITGRTGETVQLTAAVTPTDMQYDAIKWESSNENVATVTDKGMVCLVGSGIAVITASVRTEQLTLTDQCQVTVKGALENYVSVTDFGAAPDDGEDDQAAFSRAFDALGKGDYAGCDTVYVPAGTYHIDPEYGIVMPANTKLYMHEDAVLQALLSRTKQSQVIGIYQSDIEVSGGTIIGDLREAGKSGESGMGIRIQYAQNVYIHDVNIKECRGDGIYIGGNGSGSTNISIIDCTIADCSRNCLGIVSAHNIYVDGCTITGAGRLHGTAPRACILIEKNTSDDVCTDIVIKNSTIDNKAVCDSQSEAYAFGSAWVNWPNSPIIQGDRLTVENCNFKGKVANYSVKNAKFINCTFDRTPIFKQNTIVQNK